MTVRVRFAPSPTGMLHIGNARAALTNWLFAHRHGGSFMLRIDDTDLQRSEERFTQAIIQDLEWLGLTHDRFVKQSDRFDRYAEAMQQLISNGRLYPCYETPEELEFKRKRQLARGEPPIYDRAALQLTQQQKDSFAAEGIKPHWRFFLKSEEMSWNDLVRGPVKFEGERLSDPVLIRADGAYLYTITSVVDDLDFDITHIFRGEDHVTNTAVQLQLFSALNDDKPCDITFAHTTLLLDVDGQGLSKRLGSLSLAQMREDGIEAMAVNSLLAHLGTSLPVEPCLSLDKLSENFDLSSFSRTSPRFDYQELKMLNHKLLTVTPYESVKDKLPAASEKITSQIWDIIRGNIDTLNDVPAWQQICFGDITPKIEDPDYIEIALSSLPSDPWSAETWAEWTNTLKQTTNRKGKLLFMPLRQALTGLDHGPEMKDLLPIIGHEKAVSRLKTA